MTVLGPRWMPGPLGGLVVALTLACAPTEAPRDGRFAPRRTTATPFVVIGIDGAEWLAVERLWRHDRLPAMSALAARGVRRSLGTDYGNSPAIWTTIATGQPPGVHGIEGFVSATEAGDRPVASGDRRVPALWSMATRGHRTVAVLGWWATWPVEPVAGLMVADRWRKGDHGVHPPGEAAFVRARDEALRGGANPFGDVSFAARDHLVAELAPEVAGRVDLTLAYFRTVDVVSHRAWADFVAADDVALARALTDRGAPAGNVIAAYEAVDRAVGAIVEAAGPAANVIVLSDHGFRVMAPERRLIRLDIGAVLEALGYLVRVDGRVDFARSRVYPFRAPHFQRHKMIRFALAGREPGGRVAETDRGPIRRRLAADLHALRFASGEQALFLRDPDTAQQAQGADLVVSVRRVRAPSMTLHVGERTIEGAVLGLRRLSGTHGPEEDGILIAAGPAIQPDADLGPITIHGVTPTLLYGLGLPVADDFPEAPWSALFTADWQQQNPVRRIPTWGPRDPSRVVIDRPDDPEELERLRALGYLDG